jgi:hypothetical protein
VAAGKDAGGVEPNGKAANDSDKTVSDCRSKRVIEFLKRESESQHLLHGKSGRHYGKLASSVSPYSKMSLPGRVLRGSLPDNNYHQTTQAARDVGAPHCTVAVKGSFGRFQCSAWGSILVEKVPLLASYCPRSATGPRPG